MKKFIYIFTLTFFIFSQTACQGVMEEFFGKVPPKEGEVPLPSNPLPDDPSPPPSAQFSAGNLRTSPGSLRAISSSNYSVNLKVNHSRYGVKNANVSARISVSTQSSR